MVGGAGFIGTHVVGELVTAGAAVTSVDRDPRGRLDRSGALSVQAEISAGEARLTDVLLTPNLDAVFVLVGTGLVPRSLDFPQADLASNVLPLLAVLEALRHRSSPPVVVYFSSAAVYGDAHTARMGEDHPTDPLSPYGVSKLAGEHYMRLYHLLYGLPTLSMRLFSVFGPGQRKLVVHDLLARLLAHDDPVIVPAAPGIERDYTYVGDIARCALRLAVSGEARGESVNVCSGVATSLAALVEELRNATGSTAQIEFTGRVRPGDPGRLVGNPTAAETLGAKCSTSLSDGLHATVEWLRASLA